MMFSKFTVSNPVTGDPYIYILPLLKIWFAMAHFEQKRKIKVGVENQDADDK